MKHNNIHIMGIAGGEESEQRIENLFAEIMTKNFPNLVKEKDTGKSEVLNKLESKRPTMRHIIIKIASLKGKERILKAARKKAGSYIPGSTNFSEKDKYHMISLICGIYGI